jgi:UDP-N-acetylmuramate--alanine ligase
MSAVAQLLLDHGCTVTGSDRFSDRGDALSVLDQLGAAGVRLHRQDGSSIRAGTTLVVSTAIENDNPDLVAAHRAGARVVHRAELLAELASGHRGLAIAGTSGKTTVTGMVGWMLEQAGRDPTVVNGGAVLGWVAGDRVGNVRKGGDPWVYEADESDRSCLYFEPDHAVITNISLDHFSLEEAVELFRSFASRVKNWLVCGRGVRHRLGDLEGGATLIEPELEPAEGGFNYRGVSFRVPVIGAHNVENALAAVVACEHLGVELKDLAEGLASFPGIHRRLELAGEAGGVRVVDDYAHNPAKMAAAWRAVQGTAARVLGVWRPHGFKPLAMMAEELADTFADLLSGGDRLYILPVYYVGGTTSQTVSSADFVDTLKGRGVPVELVPGYEPLRARLREEMKAGDTVLCMGARDPELPRFARGLVGAGVME